MNEHLESLLPEYVNGTLNEADRALIDDHLADDEALRQELEWLQVLSAHVKEETVQSPAEFGLARLRASVSAPDADSGSDETLSGPAKSPSASDQAVSHQAPSGNVSWWRNIAVAAGLVLAVQTSFVMLDANQDLDPGYVALDGTPKGATLQVQFLDSASSGDITQLLNDSGLTIVHGPSALGIYRLQAENPERALEALESSALIRHAALE